MSMTKSAPVERGSRLGLKQDHTIPARPRALAQSIAISWTTSKTVRWRSAAVDFGGVEGGRRVAAPLQRRLTTLLIEKMLDRSGRLILLGGGTRCRKMLRL